MFDNQNPKETGNNRAFLHTAQAGAILPFLQSTMTGFLSGMVAFLMLLKFRVMALDALFYGAMVWLVVQAVCWLVLQLHWFNLTKLEKLTGLDLNRDGAIGEEPAHETRHTVRVDIQEVAAGGHLRVTTARFAVPEWKMVELANGLMSGTPFSEKAWTGSNGVFSKNEFRVLRDEMLKRRLIRPASQKSASQGYVLTLSGIAAMRNLAGHSPTPSENVAHE